jgi:hypothetical protein
VINFLLQMSFYQFKISPYIFAPVVALIVTILFPTINYIFFYALVIFSIIDHIMYLAFIPFMCIFIALGASLYMYSDFGGIKIDTNRENIRFRELQMTQSVFERVETENLISQSAIVHDSSLIGKFGSLTNG